MWFDGWMNTIERVAIGIVVIGFIALVVSQAVLTNEKVRPLLSLADRLEGTRYPSILPSHEVYGKLKLSGGRHSSGSAFFIREREIEEFGGSRHQRGYNSQRE